LGAGDEDAEAAATVSSAGISSSVALGLVIGLPAAAATSGLPLVARDTAAYASAAVSKVGRT
jgi:hypothetical protein